eukprot:7448670-Pyramimonas_sp.AAC.1
MRSIPKFILDVALALQVFLYTYSHVISLRVECLYADVLKDALCAVDLLRAGAEGFNELERRLEERTPRYELFSELCQSFSRLLPVDTSSD